MQTIKTAPNNVVQVLNALFGVGSQAAETYAADRAARRVQQTEEDFCGWIIGHTNDDGSFSVNASGGDVQAGRRAA